jgi:hypothetical protein
MRRMTSFISLGLAGLLVAAVLTASQNQVFDLSTILSSSWEGSTPGNSLKLEIRSVPTDPSHQFDLFLQVTGAYQGTNVRQQGLVRLESQGRGVYLGYVPHFDPAVTALSPDAARFNEREADAACGFNLKTKGDGFVGETVGSTCVRAMRGAMGKWTIEVEPGSMRIRNVESGETLRFKRVSK